MHRRGHVRRQAGVSALAPQTAEGIVNSEKVVDETAAADATGLAFDPEQTASIPVTDVPLINYTITKTEPTPTPTPTESPPAPTGTLENASGASSPISLKTVIGACVGAFIGAVAFILLALFFYRRYSQSLKRRANRRGTPRSVFDSARNGRGDHERRRSKLEPWNELKDTDEDKWEGMGSAAGTPVTGEFKEMKNLSPGMHHSSPDADGSAVSPHNAAYMSHPYGTAAPPKVPEARDLLGREPHNALGEINSGPPISWAASDSNSSYLSATRLNGGAMSPTLVMAIPTPPATRSQLHRWESAEVVNISEGESAEIVHEHPRQSLHNPFFNAVEEYPIHSRIRSNSTSQRPSRSRSSSTATLQRGKAASSTAENEKKKEREVSFDPFRDPLPKPKFIHHIHASSSTSSSSNDRAIRQLVAAASLDDLSEDEVQRRLRVASMQPSIISNSGDSMYTDADPDPVEEAMMRSFPVPPSSSGHDTLTYSHK